jgi:hypothetical protein
MVDVPPEISNVLRQRLFESLKIISEDQLTEDERTVVPDWWLEASQLPPEAAIARAIEAWQSSLPDAFPGFLQQLRDNGRGVFLGRSESENKTLLAYVVTVASGETVCWYGFPPSQVLDHPTLDLALLPGGPHRLYTQLHDGFKLASPFHNGFPASAELFAVGEDLDVNDAEITGGKAAPDLNKLVSLFFDFGASSVCVELDEANADRSDGWVVSDAQIQPVEDIWTTIDQWMRSLVAS